MFEIFIGAICSLCLWYYFSNKEKKKHDEQYDVYNPTEFFDNDDKEVSECLTADMMKMRLYREVIVDMSSGTGFEITDEFLMKEDDNKKILIKEVCKKTKTDNYGKGTIETSLPHELIFEKYAELSFNDEEFRLLDDEEKEKFEEYKTTFTPDDLNEKLRKEYYKDLKRVGSWNPPPKDWDYMVTKMFVDIRKFYEKNGKSWSPIEHHSI